MIKLNLFEKIKVAILKYHTKHGAYPTHIILNEKYKGKTQTTNIYDCKIIYCEEGGVGCFNENIMIKKIKQLTGENSEKRQTNTKTENRIEETKQTGRSTGVFSQTG